MTDRDKTDSPPDGPLRRRMSEDVTVRGFTPCTQRGYLAAAEANRRNHPATAGVRQPFTGAAVSMILRQGLPLNAKQT